MIWKRNYKVNLEDMNPKSTPVLAEINIYTDGSKTKDHTGSGFAIYRHKTEKFNGIYRLPGNATAFQAEIYAIKEAIREYSILRLQNEKQVKLFTDSQAALMALTHTNIKSQLVYETITELNLLAQKVNSLEICWIKAHVGHTGNERADELANQAINKTLIRTDLFPPVSERKAQLKAAIYQRWGDEWINQKTCRLSKNFLPKPCPNKKQRNSTLIKESNEKISGNNYRSKQS